MSSSPTTQFLVITLLLGSLWFFFDLENSEQVVEPARKVMATTKSRTMIRELGQKISASQAKVKSEILLKTDLGTAALTVRARRELDSVTNDRATEHVEKSIRLLEKMNVVWERKRDQFYDEIGMTSEDHDAIIQLREERDRELKEAFRRIEGQNVAEAEYAPVAAEIDLTNKIYTAKVKQIMGTHTFKKLQDKLDAFNKRIEARSPVKTKFVDVW